MTKSKQPKKNIQKGELSDAALSQASGGMLACMPTDQLTVRGTGVLADPPGEIQVRPAKGN
jgi:hypothetical protein